VLNRTAVAQGPGSICQLAQEFVDGWIPATSAGMTVEVGATVQSKGVGRNRRQPYCAEATVQRCNALPLIAPYVLFPPKHAAEETAAGT
jgi:hypothetical protein